MTTPTAQSGPSASSLLPCPFCGAASPELIEFPNSMESLYRILCSDVRCMAMIEGHTKRRAELVWNRRVTTPPAGARDAVTDAMVERAAIKWCEFTDYKLNELGPTGSALCREHMRAALEAALTGKADAYDDGTGRDRDYSKATQPAATGAGESCNRDCDCVGECKAGLETNTAASGLGDAVAWRYRYFNPATGFGFWRYSEGEPQPSAQVGGLGFEKQPLALAAQPAPGMGGGEGDGWPAGELNREKTLQVLRAHNEWRRGKEAPQTDPRMLGLALDSVIAALSTRPAESVAQGGEGFRGLDLTGRPIYGRQAAFVTTTTDSTTPATGSGGEAVGEMLSGNAYLNVAGLRLRDGTKLYTHPAPAGGDAGEMVARLKKWATDCEHSDDAEDGAPGVFVPNVFSGDFYDVLTEAARKLTAKPGAEGEK